MKSWHGLEAARFADKALPEMHLLRYTVLDKVQDGRRPTAAKNPVDFLHHGGG
jgi:hypothetical protein